MEWWFWYGSYSIADIQGCLEFIIKKTRNFDWESTSSNLSKQNQKQNCFQNKNGIQIRIVNLWNNEIVRSTKQDVDKDNNGENVPKLESVEVALVHCNIVKNDYQHSSKVLLTFVPNK